MRAAAITIDVDSLRFYRAIHGQAPHRAEDDSGFEPIYHIALPRFFELLDAFGVPATLFLIGEDAARFADAFSPLGGIGAEVASHSYRHDYRLSRRSSAEIEADLEAAESALAPLDPTGRVIGFRAPGYNVSPTLLEVLERRGYRYDSSLLPAPAYWAARAAAIARYAVLRRPSASIVGHPMQFAGPTEPYRMRPRAAWRPAEGDLIEYPMAVHPRTRTPLIGTSWVLLPAWVRERWLTTALARRSIFTFEMHAIDLLDHTDPGIPHELAAVQPDLRVPVSEKIAAFRSLFGRLADDRPTQTLREITRRFRVL